MLGLRIGRANPRLTTLYDMMSHPDSHGLASASYGLSVMMKLRNDRVMLVRCRHLHQMRPQMSNKHPRERRRRPSWSRALTASGSVLPDRRGQPVFVIRQITAWLSDLITSFRRSTRGWPSLPKRASGMTAPARY